MPRARLITWKRWTARSNRKSCFQCNWNAAASAGSVAQSVPLATVRRAPSHDVNNELGRLPYKTSQGRPSSPGRHDATTGTTIGTTNDVVGRRATKMIARRNIHITNLGRAGRREEIVAMFRQNQNALSAAASGTNHHDDEEKTCYDVSNLATTLSQLANISRV
jgi:hypothetical protein